MQRLRINFWRISGGPVSDDPFLMNFKLSDLIPSALQNLRKDSLIQFAFQFSSGAFFKSVWFHKIDYHSCRMQGQSTQELFLRLGHLHSNMENAHANIKIKLEDLFVEYNFRLCHEINFKSNSVKWSLKLKLFRL